MNGEQAGSGWLQYRAEAYTLHSGARSHFLIDADRIYDFAPLKEVVLDTWEAELRQRPLPALFVAIPRGGLIWGQAIAERMKMAWCSADDFHPNLVGDRYIYIVDDVLTSGDSVQKLTGRLAAADHYDYGVLVVADRCSRHWIGIISWMRLNLPLLKEEN